MSHEQRKGETREEYLARRRKEYRQQPAQDRVKRQDETHEQYLARRRAEYAAKTPAERRKDYTRIVTEEQKEARRAVVRTYNRTTRKARAAQKREENKAAIIEANLKWLATGGCIRIGELLRSDDPPHVGTKIVIDLIDGVLTQRDITHQTKFLKRNYLFERA